LYSWIFTFVAPRSIAFSSSCTSHVRRHSSRTSSHTGSLSSAFFTVIGFGFGSSLAPAELMLKCCTFPYWFMLHWFREANSLKAYDIEKNC